MDKNFGRILSLERYKRNHLYIETLFSPNSISTLQRPALFPDTTQEKLNAVIDLQVFLVNQKQLEKEVQELKAGNEKSIKELKLKSKEEWKKIHDLKLEYRKATGRH